MTLGPAFTTLCDQLATNLTQRIWRAIMLSPTLEVCNALLRNEQVPLNQLDPVWVERFGLK